MLRLADIMTRDLVTLAPEQSLREAMDVLSTRHITGAPVVRGRRVVGVISLTDLAEFAANSPAVPTERPDFADPDDWDALDVPVDDSEPPAAFFSELWDDAGADVVERITRVDGPEWNVLEEYTVGEAMNRRVIALAPDTPIDKAARFMRDHAVHRVLVMENDELLGMVTNTDLAATVGDRREPKRVYVFGRAAEERGM